MALNKLFYGKIGLYGAAVVGVIALIAVLWIIAVKVLPPSVLYASEMSQAKRYIAQLEKYKEEHRRYPDEQTQTIVPRSETSPFFYRGGGAIYTLRFNVGFDETYYYASDTRKWSFEK